MKMVKIVILLLIIAGGFFYHSRKSRSADLKIKEGTKVANIVLNAKIKTSKGDIKFKINSRSCTNDSNKLCIFSKKRIL